MADTVLQHPEGRVKIVGLPNGKRLLRVSLSDETQYCQSLKWETAYPVELIQKILEVKGIFWFCDEIIREENPLSVASKLERNLLNYYSKEDFQGKRILDFGSGCAASTMNLARLFPESEIVGVELDEPSLSVANARREFYGYQQVKFLKSPSSSQLPNSLGLFDFVNMNAVYEHLFPRERRQLLAALWSSLNSGGALFISETPYRYSLFEFHSTGLPLANFMPEWILKRVAFRFSKRIEKDMTWDTILRNGIRGGSEREILSILKKCPGSPELLQPTGKFGHSRIEAWPVSFKDMDAFYRVPLAARYYWASKGLTFLLKAINRLFHLPYAGDLSLAIRKNN